MSFMAYGDGKYMAIDDWRNLKPPNDLIIPVSRDKKEHLDCSLTCSLDRGLISQENEELKAELERARRNLEQNTLDIMSNLDELNRARHALELKDEEIKRLEKRFETQGQTLADYVESNMRLERDAARPCFCDTKLEIASESFRFDTLQTTIRWGAIVFIALSAFYLLYLRQS